MTFENFLLNVKKSPYYRILNATLLTMKKIFNETTSNNDSNKISFNDDSNYRFEPGIKITESDIDNYRNMKFFNFTTKNILFDNITDHDVPTLKSEFGNFIENLIETIDFLKIRDKYNDLYEFLVEKKTDFKNLSEYALDFQNFLNSFFKNENITKMIEVEDKQLFNDELINDKNIYSIEYYILFGSIITLLGFIVIMIFFYKKYKNKWF